MLSAWPPVVFLPFLPRPDSQELSFRNDANSPLVPSSPGLLECCPKSCLSECCSDVCLNFCFADNLVTEEQGMYPYPLGMPSAQCSTRKLCRMGHIGQRDDLTQPRSSTTSQEMARELLQWSSLHSRTAMFVGCGKWNWGEALHPYNRSLKDLWVKGYNIRGLS